MKHELNTYRKRTLFLLGFAPAALILLILAVGALNHIMPLGLISGLIQMGLLWILIIIIAVSIINLIFIHRQTMNLKRLDLNQMPQVIRSESPLQWAEGHFYVWEDHLLFLDEKSHVMGVDLETVRSLKPFFFSEKPLGGILYVRHKKGLPDLFFLAQILHPKQYHQELRSFLDSITKAYPHIRTASLQIACPNRRIWNDLRFVTSTATTAALVFTTPFLLLIKEIPIPSLVVALFIGWFWLRRFRLLQRIGQKKEIFVELAVFTAPLLSFLLYLWSDFEKDSRGLSFTLLFGVLLFRNYQLKNLILAPYGVADPFQRDSCQPI